MRGSDVRTGQLFSYVDLEDRVRRDLDLVEPATITIGADGHGEIAFGAMQAGLQLGYSTSIVSFTWAGCDEMDEVSGDGHAELLDDGAIEIALAYHNGDEAILKPSRDFFNSLLGEWDDGGEGIWQKGFPVS